MAFTYLGPGFMQGYESGMELQKQREARDAAAAWGRAMLGMNNPQQTGAPPMPGQPSVPMGPPPVFPTRSGGAPSPPPPGMEWQNQYAEGGPGSRALPIQGAPSGAGSATLGAQRGPMSIFDIAQLVQRNNPDVDITSPSGARILAAAVGQALPMLSKNDQDMYKAMLLGIQQDRADTAREAMESRAASSERGLDIREKQLAIQERIADIKQQLADLTGKKISAQDVRGNRALDIKGRLADTAEKAEARKALGSRAGAGKETSAAAPSLSGIPQGMRAPKKGDVVNGYILVGDNFTDEKSWMPVQAPNTPGVYIPGVKQESGPPTHLIPR